jgi:hypothetical protein
MWTLVAIAAVVLIMAGVFAWYHARASIEDGPTKFPPR